MKFFASFFLSCILALLVVSWLASQFVPRIDPSLFVPHYRPQLFPENELFLFVLGVGIVLICSIVGWKLLEAIPLPRRMEQSVKTLLGQFEALVAIIIAGICLYGIILLVFSPPPIRTFLVSQFQSYSYVYAEEYHPVQWMATLALVICIFFLWYRTPLWLQIMGKKRITRILFDMTAVVYVVAFVSVVIPWNQGKLAGIYSFEPVIGPISDVLGGKTILVDAHSQYGVLFIYALAGVFSFLPLSLDNFFWVNYVTTIIGYLLLYAGLRVWTKSITAGFLALFLASQHHYFSQDHNMLFYSMSTFLRFGWWTVLLPILLLKEKWQQNAKLKMQNVKSQIKIKNYLLHGIELILVGIAVFWGFDVGVYILAAYAAYVFVSNFGSVSNMLRALSRIIVTLLMFFVTISLFTLLRSGQLPDWYRYAAPAFEFSGGFHLTPMPPIGMHYVVIAVYLGVMTYVLYRLLMGKRESILAYIGTYGIFQFFYYVGESTNGNLHIVILPFLVLLVWLAVLSRAYVGWITRLPGREKFALLSIVSSLLVGFSIVTYAGLLNTAGTLKRRGPLAQGMDAAFADTSYWQSVAAINAYLGERNRPDRRVAIVSAYEWMLHMHTKSVNVMDVNTIMTSYRMSEVEALGAQLLARNPPIVFVDSQMYYPVWEIVMPYVKQNYHRVKNVGFLDVWEKI